MQHQGYILAIISALIFTLGCADESGLNNEYLDGIDTTNFATISGATLSGESGGESVSRLQVQEGTEVLVIKTTLKPELIPVGSELHELSPIQGVDMVYLDSSGNLPRNPQYRFRAKKVNPNKSRFTISDPATGNKLVDEAIVNGENFFEIDISDIKLSVPAGMPLSLFLNYYLEQKVTLVGKTITQTVGGTEEGSSSSYGGLDFKSGGVPGSLLSLKGDSSTQNTFNNFCLAYIVQNAAAPNFNTNATFNPITGQDLGMVYQDPTAIFEGNSQLALASVYYKIDSTIHCNFSVLESVLNASDPHGFNIVTQRPDGVIPGLVANGRGVLDATYLRKNILPNANETSHGFQFGATRNAAVVRHIAPQYSLPNKANLADLIMASKEPLKPNIFYVDKDESAFDSAKGGPAGFPKFTREVDNINIVQYAGLIAQDTYWVGASHFIDNRGNGTGDGLADIILANEPSTMAPGSMGIMILKTVAKPYDKNNFWNGRFIDVTYDNLLMEGGNSFPTDPVIDSFSLPDLTRNDGTNIKAIQAYASSIVTMDIDEDGFMDLVTVSGDIGHASHVFMNTGQDSNGDNIYEFESITSTQILPNFHSFTNNRKVKHIKGIKMPKCQATNCQGGVQPGEFLFTDENGGYDAMIMVAFDDTAGNAIELWGGAYDSLTGKRTWFHLPNALPAQPARVTNIYFGNSGGNDQSIDASFVNEGLPANNEVCQGNADPTNYQLNPTTLSSQEFEAFLNGNWSANALTLIQGQVDLTTGNLSSVCNPWLDPSQFTIPNCTTPGGCDINNDGIVDLNQGEQYPHWALACYDIYNIFPAPMPGLYLTSDLSQGGGYTHSLPSGGSKQYTRYVYTNE